MITVVVLFNLKDATAVADYERWAREVDMRAVCSLPSVNRFEVLRTKGMFDGGAPPYQYVELLRISDIERFGNDVSSALMQKVAAEFRSFADDPKFMITESL
jgi:hypothetical protein